MLYLYKNGYDTSDIYPILTAYLALVVAGELLRFSFDGFNVLYCNVMGPLMRKTEIHSRVNGVVYYLMGCIFALYFFPRDLASLAIVYLSWADPTASICGRLWGKYTPKFGKKSLAGSLGAVAVGALVTYFFFAAAWPVSSYDSSRSSIPLAVLALYGGCVAAFSEALGDCLGLDDNLVIPALSVLMLWLPLVYFGLGA